jgi:hypothetical protein
MKHWDEDRRQEYECLLLEGHDDAEAERLSASADDRTNRNRVLGPMRNGQRPMVLNFGAIDADYVSRWDGIPYEGTMERMVPFTQDQRTPEEREAEYVRAEYLWSLVRRLPPRQSRFIDLLFGLRSGTPASYAEIQAYMGVTKGTMNTMRRQSLANLRLYAGAETELDRARREARRERSRAKNARRAA